MRQLRDDAIVSTVLQRSCIGANGDIGGVDVLSVRVETNRTLAEFFDHLLNLTDAFHFPACTDYKDFDREHVKKDIATVQLRGSLAEQATKLYKFLAHKYCFYYWFVQVNDGFFGGWGHYYENMFFSKEPKALQSTECRISYAAPFLRPFTRENATKWREDSNDFSSDMRDFVTYLSSDRIDGRGS